MRLFTANNLYLNIENFISNILPKGFRRIDIFIVWCQRPASFVSFREPKVFLNISLRCVNITNLNQYLIYIQTKVYFVDI